MKPEPIDLELHEATPLQMVDLGRFVLGELSDAVGIAIADNDWQAARSSLWMLHERVMSMIELLPLAVGQAIEEWETGNPSLPPAFIVHNQPKDPAS